MARLPERTCSTRKAVFYIFRCCCLNLFCTRMFNSDGCYFEECLLETTGGLSAGLFLRRKLRVVRWFSGPTGRRWLFILVSTRDSKTLPAFSVLTELIQALFHSPLELCQPALAAHLRGFAMPDALRRSVNRHLLCPASPDGQADFMRGRWVAVLRCVKGARSNLIQLPA